MRERGAGLPHRLSRRRLLALVAGLGAGLGAGAWRATDVGGSAGGDPGSPGAPGVGYTTAGTAALEGAPWRLARYAGLDGAVRTVLAGTEITATFRAGRLRGSSGCNAYTGAYQLSGQSLTLGPVAGTRRLCAEPPGVMEQEAAYLAALPTARTYRVEGDRLLLETASGARVASFVPAPAPGTGAPPPAPGPGGAADPMRKVTFDLDQIDPTGLSGPPGGQVAVGYEFCIPATPGHLAEVQGIDPGVRAQPGSPGRIGCGPGQVLCLGSTHQPGWRSVLERLAALDYVARIDRFWGE
ncbi:MAG TPA: META domain-containing protein [Chloroflexota bacterium]|nr:META domain-containing protein [Chloroflexota bacterium]